MKKFLSNILRGLISFGILGGLIYFIGFGNIVNNLKDTDYTYLCLGLGIYILVTFLLAVRWHVLLTHLDSSPGYFRLVTFYYIGYFFNNFLPTTIGGDVSRAFYVSRTAKNPAVGLGSVVFERILGVLVTLTLASISMLWVIPYLGNEFHYLMFVTIGLLGIVIFSLVNLFNPALFNFTTGLLAKITLLGIGQKINKVLHSIHEFRESKTTILQGYFISLSCQLLFIVMNYVLALSLGLDKVALSLLVLVVPATFVMGLVPSLNGLGVRESGYVLFLATIFKVTTSDQAVALSLLNTFVPVMLSFVGGILLIFNRSKPEPQTIE